ncbi:hypothetical protein CEXT_259901 [Caerostris extrusa]|uniref:Uncharacterized protein n=1 Tax=Caerostris extrusa TaxID=172846 RepID=A0AAV4TW31_CAEEX|nr:hypothetical protein CEXT_259901 [Caerostris extrusa]
MTKSVLFKIHLNQNVRICYKTAKKTRHFSSGHWPEMVPEKEGGGRGVRSNCPVHLKSRKKCWKSAARVLDLITVT